VTVQEPAIEARVVGAGELPLGEDVTVELTSADPGSRSVGFTMR
jgi:hypothetical protein